MSRVPHSDNKDDPFYGFHPVQIELKAEEIEYDGPELQFAPDMLRLILSFLPCQHSIWNSVMRVCKFWNEVGRQVFDPTLPFKNGVLPIVQCSKEGKMDAIKSIVNLPKYRFKSSVASSCMMKSLENKHFEVFRFFLERGGFDTETDIPQMMDMAPREMKVLILDSDKINWASCLNSSRLLNTVRRDYDLILALEERGIKVPDDPDQYITFGIFPALRRVVELHSHKWNSNNWRRWLRIASRNPSLEIFHYLREKAGPFHTMLFVLLG
eukprot:TRINITY_DN2502_c0_g1_i2.p1 TRINITY_DN2502_c0_g1~~TRINITY_DN2502_c0_g1_i2.p1  ORF type:complete len:268 (+),score=64.55 TRINITY_DN2502_c0_g1_i2:69-872(+)